MNKPYLIRSEEQDNLRIVASLNVQNLPEPVQSMLSLFYTGRAGYPSHGNARGCECMRT